MTPAEQVYKALQDMGMGLSKKYKAMIESGYE